jgi:predicted AAA+ superfamily ATPase
MKAVFRDRSTSIILLVECVLLRRRKLIHRFCLSESLCDTYKYDTSKYDYSEYFIALSLSLSIRYMPNFVIRTEEFTYLRALLDSDDAELVVLYGRRRLGKTRLVKQALEDQDGTVI